MMKKIVFSVFMILVIGCKEKEDFTCSEYQLQIIEKITQNTLLQKRVDSLQNELKKAELYIDLLEHPITTNEN